MRTIDADELKKKLEAEHCDCEVIQIIDDMPTAAEAMLVKRETTNREEFLDATTNFELASMILSWKQPVLPCSYCAWTRNTCGLSSCLSGVMEWLSLKAVEGSEKREK